MRHMGYLLLGVFALGAALTVFAWVMMAFESRQDSKATTRPDSTRRPDPPPS